MDIDAKIAEAQEIVREYERQEAERKLEHRYRQAMSDVAMCGASAVMMCSVVNPDPVAAGKGVAQALAMQQVSLLAFNPDISLKQLSEMMAATRTNIRI